MNNKNIEGWEPVRNLKNLCSWCKWVVVEGRDKGFALASCQYNAVRFPMAVKCMQFAPLDWDE